MAIKEVIEITNKIMSKWMGIGGIAPDSVVDKMHNARLDWIIQLTDCLEIWTDRGGRLSEGELLLARANIGAIVEGWLKFFYCVYYEDYKNCPKKDRDGNIIEPTKKDLEKDETPETDNTNDYYASYFNKITKSFNNLTNSVIQGSAKNDSDNTNKNLDLTRWLSLSDVSVSVNSITVNYNVFDPNNEYNSVFIDFESSNLNGMKRIQLSKESNSYIINELIPDTEYKITIGYTLQENPKQEVYDDIVKVKTNKPDYRINVTKVTQNKVYFNVKIDPSYVIENGNIAMYVDDELYNVSKIDIKKASTKAGWDSSFDFERKQSMVELKLENLKYNGNDIDINVSYKYKN